MKDWFGSRLKIKRWLLLVLAGTITLAYGIANLMLSPELAIGSIITTMLLFMIGMVAIVTGFIMSQRRVMQVLAESGSQSNNRNFNIKKLLYDKKAIDKSIKIVTIGQGDGMDALLQGMKHFSSNITTIVSTLDYHLDSSEGMTEIKKAIMSLACHDKEELERFLNYRIKTGKDMNATIFEAMMAIHENNFSKAVSGISEVIAIDGKILPSTIDNASLGVVLSDGSRIHGRDNIIASGRKPTRLPIERVFLTPERCAPAPGVIKSIKEADLIIIGPGSLYTGILPILLMREVADEIKKSKAVKVFVSSIMTEPGQTDNYSVSDYINAIHEHTGKGMIDYCVASDSDIMPEYIRKYNQNNSDIVDIDKVRIKNTDVKLEIGDMTVVDHNGKIRHDSLKLAKAIVNIMLQNLDISENEQAMEYYNMKNKLKNMNSKHKKKNVLFRNVKIIK